LYLAYKNTKKFLKKQKKGKSKHKIGGFHTSPYVLTKSVLTMMPEFVHTWMALAHLGKMLAVDEDEKQAALHWPQMDHHFVSTVETDDTVSARLSYIAVASRNGPCGVLRFEIPRKLKHIFDGAWLPDKAYLHSVVKVPKEISQSLDTWDKELLADLDKDYFFVDD